MEKVLLSADEDDEQVEDVKEQNDSEEKKKKQKAKPKARNKKKKVPAKPKDKNQDGVLNLNNEVVLMRKEVKRVRVLIIRRLIRQISASKKKKGNEAQVEKSQRKAARMVEEIHAMKVLRPDVVTKTALQKNLNFEQVCRDPKSSIVDRAVARIATHPQFSKKIEDIKAAVEAFKKERMKDLKQGGAEKVQIKAEQVKPQSPDKSKVNKRISEEENVKVQPKGTSENKEEDVILKDSSVAEPETDTVIAAPLSVTADDQKKVIPESESVRPVSTQTSKVKDTVKNDPQSKGAAKKPNAAVIQTQEKEEVCELESSDKEESDLDSLHEGESDLESSDEKEKEYFDDSTEERFHKQSSQSEESDDDFFVGKVSKFKKKKKKQKVVEGEKTVEKEQGATSEKAAASDKLQDELDELESRLKSKSSLQSVFTSSLSGPMKSAGRGGGRGRGGDTFRGQKKPNAGRGFNKDFSKQSKFQKEFTGAEGNSGTKHSKPEDRRRESEERGFGGRGRGRGRGDFTRPRGHMGRGGFTQQEPQQALHPSWEASKKRKEQQGQILAFQGKKIKFDDDD